MPDSIENYAPQAAVEKQRRQAFLAWSVILAISLLWTLSTVAAPLAKANGLDAYADSIYSLFGYLCHQISWRSFHVAEHPFAVCARCFGFYAGFLISIAIYPLFRAPDNTDSFPRYRLFLAMIPMGVDWSLTFFGVWENTHLSRAVSGAILGAACAFFIVPAIVEISHFFGAKFQKTSRIERE